MQIKYTWSNFKSFIPSESMHYMTNGDGYVIWAHFSGAVIYCTIISSTEVTDFETSYKNDANAVSTEKENSINVNVITQTSPVKLKTYHKIDTEETEKDVGTDSDVLFKTYSSSHGIDSSLLSSLLLTVSDNEIIIIIEIDDVEYTRINIDHFFNYMAYVNGFIGHNKFKDINVFATGSGNSNRVIELNYQYLPIQTNLKIKMRRTDRNRDTSIYSVCYVYSKEVT